MIRWFRRTASVVVAAAVVGSFVLLDPLSRLGGDDDGDVVVARERSELAVATLSTTNEADGELVSTEQRPVLASGGGTVTSIVSTGTAVAAGAVLFTIDESPVLALPGTTPAWRTMTVDDVGSDVLQLEAGLVELGYDGENQLTVDDSYTSVTASIVERWQEDVGLPVTGTVALGSIVFVPPQAQVSSVDVGAGQAVAPGTTVLTLSSADRHLTATVSADQLASIDIGQVLSVRLPDRTTVDATVTEIAGSGDGTWRVTGQLTAAGAELPDGEAVPVTVSWSAVIADEVLTVRASTLTRLDAGTYTLEVVEGDGDTRFVEVGIGNRSGSTVEIITDLGPGTMVISP